MYSNIIESKSQQFASISGFFSSCLNTVTSTIQCVSQRILNTLSERTCIQTNMIKTARFQHIQSWRAVLARECASLTERLLTPSQRLSPQKLEHMLLTDKNIHTILSPYYYQNRLEKMERKLPRIYGDICRKAYTYFRERLRAEPQLALQCFYEDTIYSLILLSNHQIASKTMFEVMQHYEGIVSQTYYATIFDLVKNFIKNHQKEILQNLSQYNETLQWNFHELLKKINKAFDVHPLSVEETKAKTHVKESHRHLIRIASIVTLMISSFFSPAYGQAIFNLNNLNGNNGFTLSACPSCEAGWALSSGDINGDGIADFLVGDPDNNDNAIDNSYDPGAVYVVYGSHSSFPSQLYYTDLNGRNGFVLYGGFDSNDGIGYDVSHGDINGDGTDDLLFIGFPNAYVVFGYSSFPASWDVGSLNGNNGFTFTAPCGVSISSGDINGDGVSDLLVGNPSIQDYVSNGPGQVYVVYGSRSPFPATLSSSDLNGTNGFIVSGINNGDGTGSSVSSGDINGDGIEDLLIGAPITPFTQNGFEYYGTGKAYVVYGSRTPFPVSFNVSKLDGTNGFDFVGINDGDQTGYSVGSGDINGDGIADLLVGAIWAPYGNGTSYACGQNIFCGPGQSYVLFGSRSPFSATFNASTLNGSNGFTLVGFNVNADGYEYGARAGTAVSSGDINGDGIADFLVATAGSNESYVMFGSQSSFVSSLYAKELNGSNGIVMRGALAGGPINSGDINGDGISDLLIGGVDIAFVVFGKNSSWVPPTTIISSSSTTTSGGVSSSPSLLTPNVGLITAGLIGICLKR